VNNRLTSAGGVTYSYDSNGNLTSTSSGQSFAWDVFNRMTSATGSGGTATYTYNGDGLKIRRIGPDGTTRYYHDGIRPIWEADGAGNMTAQLDRDIFGNLLSRKEPAGTRRYYHFDGLGSTTALSDESGAAVATLLYDAWGNQRTATGASVPNYRFTGAELDSASGLYHMGARFYDPTIGRWLSEDSAQDQQFNPISLNYYAYAFGNPAVRIDPDGDAPCLTTAGIDQGECGGGVGILFSFSRDSNILTRIVSRSPLIAGILFAGWLISEGVSPDVAALAGLALAIALDRFLSSRGFLDLPYGWRVEIQTRTWVGPTGQTHIVTTVTIFDENGKPIEVTSDETVCAADENCP
jgi:RHS repeat-associated protein